MTEPKKIRTRSHTPRDFTVKLANGNTVIVQSDDKRNARKAAIMEYGEAAVIDVDYATGSRRSNAWDAKDINKPARNRAAMRQHRATLNTRATAQGWKSWYEYEAAVARGEIAITPKS